MEKPAEFDLFDRHGEVDPQLDLSNGYLIVVQHSVTTEYEQSYQNTEETLHAIKASGSGQTSMPDLMRHPAASGHSANCTQP